MRVFPKATFSSTSYFTKSNMKSGMDYRLYLHNEKKKFERLSFWHDIDYKNPDNTYNMVVEIPKGRTEKFEVNKEETFNPIKQDTKINKITKESYLRFYKLAPDFNYGMIPRTWENSKIKHFHDNYPGDDDPLDVVEFSDFPILKIGEVVKIYIVGSFCLIDQGEVDWKILAVNSKFYSHDDSLKFSKEKIIQQKITNIQQWFKFYKTYEGKKANSIYKEGKILNIEETKEIIDQNHKYYMDLINLK